jgi:hypothetical protein
MMTGGSLKEEGNNATYHRGVVLVAPWIEVGTSARCFGSQVQLNLSAKELKQEYF